MITFLPHESFARSAKSLDKSRLGKQRAEVKQILCSIYEERLREDPRLAEEAGVSIHSILDLINHPAKIMWEDYPQALVAYGLVVCQEWRSRGCRDLTYSRIEAFAADDVHPTQEWLAGHAPHLLPPWLGDTRLHASHRSNLLRKDRIWYGVVQNWSDRNDLPYFWPGRDYRNGS